jgi:hypothetical protein
MVMVSIRGEPPPCSPATCIADAESEATKFSIPLKVCIIFPEQYWVSYCVISRDSHWSSPPCFCVCAPRDRHTQQTLTSHLGECYSWEKYKCSRICRERGCLSEILPIVPMQNGADRLTGSRLELHAFRVSHWNQRCLHDCLERNTE